MSNKGINLDSLQYVKVDNKLYMVSDKWNALVSIDISTDQLSVISYVPERISDVDFSNILYWNKHLILIPFQTNKVWFFSIEEHMWKSCEICNEVAYKENRLFCASYITNGILYMIGVAYPGIVKIDLEKKEFLGCIPIYENVLECRDKFNEGFSFFNYIVVDNELYIASVVSNVVHVLDLVTESYRDIKVGKETDRYAGIAYDGNTFWLAARKGTGVYRWDGKNNFQEIVVNSNNDKYCFSAVYFYENTIVAAGFAGESNYYINPNNDEYTQGTEDYVIKQICDDETMVCRKGGEILLMHSNELIVVNARIDWSILKEGFEDAYKTEIKTLFAGQVLIENESISLDDYITLI